MLKKHYEIRCDFCKCTIDYWSEKKPTEIIMEKVGIIRYKKKHFCTAVCLEMFKESKENEHKRN